LRDEVAVRSADCHAGAGGAGRYAGQPHAGLRPRPQGAAAPAAAAHRRRGGLYGRHRPTDRVRQAAPVHPLLPVHKYVLAATVSEDEGVVLTAAVRERRRPRPGVRGGALVVMLAV